MAAYKRKVRAENPEKVKSQEARYRAHNREERKEKQRVRQKRYSERMKTVQNVLAGRKRPDQCEICEKSDVKICYDHCHKTGSFRGWLCLRCNSALGLVGDDVKILSKLIDYLKESV